jgi:hypothetical protein
MAPPEPLFYRFLTQRELSDGGVEEVRSADRNTTYKKPDNQRFQAFQQSP